MTFSPVLAADYVALFRSCVITPARLTEINQTLKLNIVTNRMRYTAVEASTGVPWAWIAITHALEASSRFTRHLHNGDPLSARTKQVPRGRPPTGTPPFGWAESAVDALRLHALDAVPEWTLARMLFEWERWNGWGYRKKSIAINTPYLWSASQHYTRGKFVADGTYSPVAVSKQIGAAVLLKRLIETGHVTEPA